MENLVLCELGEPGEPGFESHSPFCLKVHRALKAAGLPYTSRRAAMPSAYRPLNPAGQVPILLVDDEPVFDSTKILQRIATLAPSAGLSASGEAWLWEDYADRALNGYVVAARWADPRNWPLVREAYFGKAPWPVRSVVAPMIRRRVLRSLHARDFLRFGEAAIWDDFRRILDALEARAPERGFWLGARLTVADLGLFGQLHALRASLTPAQAREIKLRPALTDWLDRVDDATRSSAPARLRDEALASAA